MADESDLAALIAGEKDMVNRDLRGQKFANLDLSGRDFSNSYLDGSEFLNVDLNGCVFDSAKIDNVKFIGSNLRSVTAGFGTLFADSEFSDCVLVGADFKDCVFGGMIFKNSDLSFANFSSSIIGEGCAFTGVIVNEETKFDNVSILRSLAKEDAFRYYLVDKGKLVRKRDAEHLGSSSESARIKAVKSISNDVNAAILQISEIEIFERRIAEDIGYGHNSGAVWSAPEDVSILEIKQQLIELRDFVATNSVIDIGALEEKTKVLEGESSKIARWIGDRFTKFADSFVAELGKSAANWKVYVGLWAVLSGKIDSVINIVGTFVRHGGMN